MTSCNSLRNILHETSCNECERPLKGMKYTAGQAAKAVGVATATITRALKSGKISGQKNDNGAWVIDPAELHRVFPPIAQKETERPFVKSNESHFARGEKPSEYVAMEREVQILREALNDAREDRDKWRDMAERLSIAPPNHDREEKPTRWKLWQLFSK